MVKKQTLSLTPATRVIVPTITFFDEKGHIHKDANALLMKHLIINKANSIFVLGSTGEGRFFMDKPEEKQMYLQLVSDTIRKMDPKYPPLLIGSYGENSDQAINDAKFCLNEVPTASLVIPPPTKVKLDPQQQLQFYEPIFQAIKAPIYLYNNPEAFGGTEITIEVVNQLKKYANFVGIKDSSGSDDQKKIYLKALTEKFTISCGKEGSLAKFLSFVPTNQRNLIGIIPSISNIVNTCADIFELGIAGKDSEMLAKQDELNQFREKVYDAAQSKGKAQRGCKIAFAHLYRDVIPNIPVTVNPSLIRKIDSIVIDGIKTQTDTLVKKGHITLVK